MIIKNKKIQINEIIYELWVTAGISETKGSSERRIVMLRLFYIILSFRDKHCAREWVPHLNLSWQKKGRNSRLDIITLSVCKESPDESTTGWLFFFSSFITAVCVCRLHYSVSYGMMYVNTCTRDVVSMFQLRKTDIVSVRQCHFTISIGFKIMFYEIM